MKIVLLGYMGSGKTTVGKKLAHDLGLRFLDLDAYIEKSERTAIADIFETRGELYFRKKEHACLKEIIENEDGFVLSTGGGTPCYGENLKAMLKGSNALFYLKVGVAELVRRLSSEKELRPLIQSIANDDLSDFIGKHLFERSYFYNQAYHTIDCDGKSIDTIVDDIITSLR